MATLQRFKRLATQCSVAPSPTRSPAASPVIHLRRRRKTLRMLLFGSTDRRKLHSCETPVPRREGPAPDGSRKLRVRHKLKDLFVSSPPPPLDRRREEDRDRLLKEPYRGVASGGFSGRRGGGSGASIRPLSAALRCRLLRKAWRPTLVAIPE
ncbi:hypothetical protein SAY87_000117 [Trapa incisa]|uniref:Uncharacterized protein n=1 Tax=Trapa incisa TaxID=236973 RepID=A0AAN7J9L7_9MYRT|nr:hypothetical protein SAY87_000117 [Trapa incisa]